jgi:hypothetical protein
MPDSHKDRATLEKYHLELFDFIDTRNGDEYKFLFIGLYFKLVDFSSPYFKVFPNAQ